MININFIILRAVLNDCVYFSVMEVQNVLNLRYMFDKSAWRNESEFSAKIRY